MIEQKGGYVSRSGMCLLHSGEPVIPIDRSKKGLSIQVAINNLSDGDWDELKKELAKIIGEVINGK